VKNSFIGTINTLDIIEGFSGVRFNGSQEEIREVFCEACLMGLAERHHIKSRGAGGSDSPENILWLCRTCHTKFHAKGWKWFINIYPWTEKQIRQALNE